MKSMLEKVRRMPMVFAVMLLVFASSRNSVGAEKAQVNDNQNINNGASNSSYYLDSGNHSDSKINLTAELADVSSPTLYYLTVTYTGNRWLYIKPGRSLSLSIGSKKVEFEGAGSAHNRTEVKGTGMQEIAYYPITEEQLADIRNGRYFWLSLIGENFRIERYLNAWDMVDLVDFCCKLELGEFQVDTSRIRLNFAADTISASHFEVDQSGTLLHKKDAELRYVDEAYGVIAALRNGKALVNNLGTLNGLKPGDELRIYREVIRLGKPRNEWIGYGTIKAVRENRCVIEIAPRRGETIRSGDIVGTL